MENKFIKFLCKNFRENKILCLNAGGYKYMMQICNTAQYISEENLKIMKQILEPIKDYSKKHKIIDSNYILIYKDKDTKEFTALFCDNYNTDGFVIDEVWRMKDRNIKIKFFVVK